MTANRNLKQRVRARATKTGESYSGAEGGGEALSPTPVTPAR